MISITVPPNSFSGNHQNGARFRCNVVVMRRATTNHSVVQRKNNLSNSRKDTTLVGLFRSIISSPHPVN